MPTSQPSVRSGESLDRRARSRRGTLAMLVGVVAASGLGACDDGSPADPGALRFGQVGSVRLLLQTPRGLGAGELRQEIFWTSDGIWSLTETVLYEGVEGDTDILALSSNQEVSASIYAEWITQVNDNPGLSLFVEGLDPFLDPACTDLTSRITLTIRDDVADQSVSWTRCAVGPLSVLDPESARPDAEAARVVSAAQFARDRTVGVHFASAFDATLPFATIDRGEDSGAPLTGPLVIDEPLAWSEFWAEHSRSQGPPPTVDFDRDLVLVVAVGERAEAGDSVEVQSVRAATEFVAVDYHERVPGNFCSPAERLHRPFHIVRAPRLPLPVFFNKLSIQRVPCG